MKLSLAVILMGLGFSLQTFAGACDTNAASLDRNFASKCSTKATRALCESCADTEFNKVVVKIETCRERLQQSLDTYKSGTCSTKP